MKKFSEQNFKEIIKEVGPWNYHIYDKGESLPGQLLKQDLDIAKYNCVVAGTGCTLANYIVACPNQPKIIIPAGVPIMVFRLFRYDVGHGEPHYNANDQIIFPTKSGDFYRFSRKDAPDHFIKITANSTVRSIADAYNLPEEKSGPVDKYSVKGAKLHVDIVPLDNENNK
ncbi:hypothetical protein D4R78_05240 [bacterium]|nr:MAG: hypothetical protein D4R78_05240 [bacterium]